MEEGNFPNRAKIDTRLVLKMCDAASVSHASQLAGRSPNRGVLSLLISWFAPNERHMRAHPELEPELKMGNLFEGVGLVKVEGEKRL